MLEIIRFNEDEYNYPCLLVLGCFDGLHLGHSELLKKAKLQAKINGLDLGVMMFTNGKGGKEGKQLYTFEERLKLLEGFNVKFVLKIDYTDEFKKIKPLEFLGLLEDKLNVKAYMCGKDFRFGDGAKGKVSTLKSFAEDEENGVWFMPIKDFTVGDEKVSTSSIKVLLDEGNVKKAATLLGRNYSVSGTVIHGADRGAKLGYPTMNIAYPDDKHAVKEGVYTARCAIGENVYYGIANYGGRPTFGEDAPVLEVYLDGFEGSCYDELVTVEFINYIRDIQKFDSAESLSAQLSQDILHAKEDAKAAATQTVATPVAPAPAPAPVKEEVPAPVEGPVLAEEPVEAPAPIEEIVEEAVEEPVEPAEEPATEELAPVEEVAIEEPVAEEIAAEEPVVEEPAAEPVAEEPAVEEPVVEEPVVEEVPEATQEAVEEEPTETVEEIQPVETVEEAVEEAVEPAEEPATEELAPVEEVVNEEPVAEETIVEEPAIVEEPVEEPASVEEVTDEEPAEEENETTDEVVSD